MDREDKIEKNRGRIEKRTAYATNNTDWLFSKKEWPNLACIGALNTQFEIENGTSNEWHYYISSRNMTAAEILSRSRKV